MKKTLASLFLLSGAAAQALTINVNLNRTFVLTSPKESYMLGGTTNVNIIDGSFTLSPCIHPSPVRVPPITNPPICPLGTTAFIQAGDIDGDGVSDDRSYWSVSSVVKGEYLEPFYPIGVTLSAAPPSKLARPLGNFVDNSLGIFYNVLGAEIELYELTGYFFQATYGEGLYKKHAEEWVPGVYIYSVPLKGTINETAPLRMTITPMVEANGYNRGTRGFGLVTQTWSNGAQETDPRIITPIRWEGNTTSNSFRGDEIRFGIDRLSPAGVRTLAYPTPDATYKLANPYVVSLNVLPYVFTKGDRGVGMMNFSRALSTSTLASDTSNRDWEWPIRYIDSYKGHDLYEYKLANDAAIQGIKVGGNPAKLRLPNSDYDGDGISNIIEFAYSQDDGNDTSASLEWTSYNQTNPPTAAVLLSTQQTAPTTAQPAFLDTLNNGVPITPLVTNKRRNVGASITYGYEVNYDTTNPKSKWVKIKGPKPGETATVADKTLTKLLGTPFTWTIVDKFDVIATTVPVQAAVLGTTSITASSALPSTVRLRSTASVTSGY